METFRRIAVYCGSSSSAPTRYFEVGHAVGRGLAERGIGVVYGGGRSGVMGAVADGALSAGGEVFGVITDKLMGLEVGHDGLTRRETVATMHLRKARMAELADAFIALPGGWGTLEELFEALTWTQLNDHLKPVGLVNVDGYYDHLLAFLDHAADQGFVRPSHRHLLQVSADLDALLDQLAAVDIPRLGSWRR